MDDYDQLMIVFIIGAIFVVGVFYVAMSVPQTVTGEVTAIQEFPGWETSTNIYIKTLNNANNALTIQFKGSTNLLKIGGVYKISVGWWRELISIEEVK